MKKMYTLAAIAATTFAAAQTGNVGINTDRPKTTLDINYSANFPVEKTQAVTFPTITTAQRDAYRNVPEGATIYNITEHCLQVFNGALWTCTDGSKIAVAPTEKCPNPIYDRKFGDGLHDFVYCEVTGPDGRIWLNNNLGANYSNIHSAVFNPAQQATSPSDYNAFGSRYQHLRGSDGHELMNWSASGGTPVNGTTTVQAANLYDVGTRQRVIDSGYSWYIGRTSQDYIAWYENGANNPCPSGYHLPLKEEVDDLITSTYIDADGHTSLFTNDKLRLTISGISSDGSNNGDSTTNMYYYFPWGAGVGVLVVIPDTADLYVADDNNPGSDPNNALATRCIKNQ